MLRDIKQVADLLGVSTRTAYRLDDEGKLPRPVTLNSLRRWSVAELEAWVAAGAPDRARWEALRAPKTGGKRRRAS